MIWYNSLHITVHDQTRSQQLKSCSDNVFCFWALKTIRTADMWQLSMQEFGCHLVHQACVSPLQLFSSCHATITFLQNKWVVEFKAHSFPDLSLSQLQYYFLELFCAKKTFHMSSNHSLHSIVSCVVSSCLVESSYLCCHIHHFYLRSGFNETKTEPSPDTSDTSNAIRNDRGSFLCEN